MENETIRKKGEYFFNQQKLVHIKTKSKFYNGLIKELSSDFFIFDDEKIGELPIFFIEILSIEPRIPKEDKPL